MNVGVGVEVDIWQAIKDGHSFVSKLKDRAVRQEIEQLLDVINTDLRKKDDSIHKLSEELRLVQCQIVTLKEIGQMARDPDHGYLVDPALPNIKYCPVCASRDGFKSPLGSQGSIDYQCRICPWYVDD